MLDFCAYNVQEAARIYFNDIGFTLLFAHVGFLRAFYLKKAEVELKILSWEKSCVGLLSL